MKKTCLLIIFLLVLTTVNTMGYVLLYPGVEFYNDDLTISFSNSDGINVSYIEVGDSYLILGDLNLSMTFTGALEINVSNVDSSGNLSKDDIVLCFNATHTSGSVVFTFTGNSSNALYKLYRDSSLLSSHEAESFSWTQSSWSIHEFEIILDGYRPDCPTGGSSDYDVNSNTVNLTWTAASYADNYVVVRRNDTYPSSVDDSNSYIVQNSSALFYNTTLISDASFTIWSYNNSGNTFSLNSCKLDIPWGAIRISVYNESNPSQSISPFGILISSSGGGSTYQNIHCTDPHKLDVLDIPYGSNTIILINGTGYKDRTYYKDLIVNHYYNYSFYLPPFETETDEDGGDTGGSGENYTTTQDYVIQVINELNNPVVGAKIVIRRYINTTDSFNEIASLLTDGYGRVDVALIPGVLYKFNITATGYQDLLGQNWNPKYIKFTDDRYRTFQLKYIEPDYDNETVYEEIITFNGYTDGTIGYVTYLDSLNETINTTIYIYETNHSTNITIKYYSDTRIGDNDFQLSFNINRSNTYVAVLFLNHSTFGYIGDDWFILHEGWWDDAIGESAKMEALFIGVLGPNPFTWTAIIGIFFLLVFLFAFGQRNAGLSIMITGFIMLALSAFFGLAFLSTSICIIIIILGILVQWRMNRRLGEG